MDKPRIILDVKPTKIIRWFTQNWDKEIGALGVGEVIKGNIFVKKLVFPDQVVNGAHVHFTPENWKPVIEELSVEELGKVIFYWHKHPDNSPSASSTDEENTFDAFMAPEAKRKIFGFLQTSLKDTTSGTIDYEARIAISKPIRLHTTDVELVFMDNNEIEKECKEIIDKRVTEGYKGPSDQPGMNKEIKTTFDYTTNKVDKTIEDVAGYLNEFNAEINHGAIVLKYSPEFVEVVDDFISGNDVLDLCNKYHHKVDKISGLYLTIIQPYRKKIDELFLKCQKLGETLDSYKDNESKITGKLGFSDCDLIEDWYHNN